MSAAPAHETARSHQAERYVGLMSGTSLDGIDAVLAEIGPSSQPRLLQTHYLPYPDSLRGQLLALHTPQADEIHLAALAANELARLYADTVSAVLDGTSPSSVRAIGCHGQTLRHRPADGYTVQIGNAALLAEEFRDLLPVLREAFPACWQEIVALTCTRVAGYRNAPR